MDYVVNDQADAALNKAMDELQARLDEAERRFESDGSMLEIKSRYSSCNDMAVLGDILSESRRITDELYASYEALIRAANSICKPLADQGVRAMSLERVVNFMKHINAECSTLGSNYSASIDSYSLGNIASTRYSPSAEARMIETNWSLLHSMHPLVAEERRAAEEAAAKLRAARAERERLEKERALAEYPQKLAAWEAEHARVTAMREELVAQAKASLVREFGKKRQTAYEKKLGELEAQRVQLGAAVRGHRNALATAGFFAFGKKAAAKRGLAELEPQLEQVERDLAALYEKGPDPVEGADFDRELARAKERVESEHPLPRRPRDPNVRSPFDPGEGATAVQIANAGIKEALYNFLLEEDRPLEITAIMARCPEACDLSNQRVSALLRQLVTDGLVERTEEKRMAFFRAVECDFDVRPASEPQRRPASTPSTSSYTSSVLSSNGDAKEAIYQFLKDEDRDLTISQIMEGCPACADLSNQRTSALIRQLVCDGLVERSERNRMAYFRAAE